MIEHWGRFSNPYPKWCCANCPQPADWTSTTVRLYLCTPCLEARCSGVMQSQVTLAHSSVMSFDLDTAGQNMVMHHTLPQTIEEEIVKSLVGKAIQGAVKAVLDEPKCNDCFDTGHWKGFGGPCKRGCRPRN